MRRTRQKSPAKPKMVRCAIYTRKSTDEGLEQDFNSLDAQREAAEAFINSQRHEGWVVLPERYDDGGFTGGNMERPALKRLLADVEARKIDAIVVYKVDRLSRSLLDFSRIMEALDAHECSFVSVTQQFNTTHSMGRLTLNILLSFAQFEREIIAERTKDKMAASRKKGKWVGGGLILGYDLDRTARRLVVNPEEATIVRSLFSLFLETQSLLSTADEANRRGWPRKTWIAKNGRQTGGGIWNKSNLRALLSNAAYTGKVRYKGHLYAGEHEAIVDEETWEAVQALLKRNRRESSTRSTPSHALLRGLLRCGSCGCAMTHSYTARGARHYRYYVCQTAMKRGWKACKTRSIPAQDIENLVMERLARMGRDPDLAAAVVREARHERAVRQEALEGERVALQNLLRQKARAVGRLGEGGSADRLAELEAQVRAGEARLAEITSELVALAPIEIRTGDVARALADFAELPLTSTERDRLVHLVVERVTFNAEKSTVAITLRPTGIATLESHD